MPGDGIVKAERTGPAGSQCEVPSEDVGPRKQSRPVHQQPLGFLCRHKRIRIARQLDEYRCMVVQRPVYSSASPESSSAFRAENLTAPSIRASATSRDVQRGGAAVLHMLQSWSARVADRPARKVHLDRGLGGAGGVEILTEDLRLLEQQTGFSRASSGSSGDLLVPLFQDPARLVEAPQRFQPPSSTARADSCVQLPSLSTLRLSTSVAPPRGRCSRRTRSLRRHSR